MALRRRRSAEQRSQRQTLVAAATALTLSDPRKAAKEAGKRQEWQQDAWTFFDVIPEIKFSTWYLGNGLSKLGLFVGVLPADGMGDPVPIDESDEPGFAQLAAPANDELDRLRHSSGGLGEIIRELDMNLEVAAECYLVGYGARDETIDANGKPVPGRAEDWEIRSIDEIVFEQGVTRVRSSPDDRGMPLDPEFDDAIRIYQRHPRWSGLADNNMRAALGDCEALLTLTAQQMAESRSRHNAGILAVPNELSAGPRPKRGEQPEDESGEQDPLSKSLVDAFVSPVDDPGSAGAVAPTIVRGPGVHLGSDQFRWIDLGRKTGDDLEKRIEQRTQRLARALNLPVEKVMGHQQTTFANAEQVDEDEFDDFHRPRSVLIVNALTAAFLRPNLIARGIPADALERVVVWFDPAALIGEPDRSLVADEAWDRNLLSDAAYRARKGITEDEAPTDEEIMARIGARRGIFTADLSRALLEFFGLPIDVVPLPEPPPQEPVPADDAGGDGEGEAARVLRDLVVASLTAHLPVERRAAAASMISRFSDDELSQLARQRMVARAIPTRAVAAAAGPRTGAGRELMDIDRELRTRLLDATETAMTTALERAGNRIKGRAGKLRELTANVPPMERAAHVGVTLLAEAGLDPDALLDGAFVQLEEQFKRWGGESQRAALNTVYRVVGGFDSATRRQLGLRQAADLDEAWTWLEQTLTSLAHARMFDPAAAVEALGEVAEGVTVPAGVIRRAIAQAGGAATLSTDDQGGAWVTLTDGGTRPAGGIGTGELMRDTLRDHGASVDAYRWVYGPALRRQPFEPHARLDQVEFSNFDDPQLAATGSFPGFAFYMPGDHGGCLCDFEPIVIGPTGTTVDTGD